MKNLVKNSVIAALVAVTSAAAVMPASAGDRWRDRGRSNAGEVFAAGALGLAAGALIAGSANRSRDPVIYRYDDGGYRDGGYYRAQPVYQRPVPVYQRTRPVYVERYASFEPWTRDWYRYCADRYRSFDPSSGTFMGYDGVRRFCEAN